MEYRQCMCEYFSAAGHIRFVCIYVSKFGFLAMPLQWGRVKPKIY